VAAAVRFRTHLKVELWAPAIRLHVGHRVNNQKSLLRSYLSIGFITIRKTEKESERNRKDSTE
jgi:hypothetical protein